jgi:EAL domain-containing protein (putative c-di-GMP-specific phosphodiesterase class I)
LPHDPGRCPIDSAEPDRVTAAALARLRAERDRFVAFALAGGGLLLELDPDGRILFATGGASALPGVLAETLVGRRLVDLVAARDRLAVARALSELLAVPHLGPLELAPAPDHLPGGRLLLSGCRLPGQAGRLHIALRPAACGAISGRDRATGLLGRLAFEALVTEAVRERGGGALRLTLIELPGWPRLAADLDLAAQAALQAGIGALLLGSAAQAEGGGRLSERGFGLLQAAGVDPAPLLCELAALTRARDPAGLGTAPRALRVALGAIAPEPAGGLRLARLIDRFLGGVSPAPTLAAGDAERMLGGAFDLVFQPIVDLASRAVHHLEALVRLPDGGSPVPVVTFAEEAGLVADLDLLVCRRVLDLLAQAPEALPAAAVNLSGRSLQSGAFARALFALLDGSAVAPARLMFELTETVAIRDPEAVAGVLAALRCRGFRVCLDDFGSGAAAFHHLRAFEVDFVKLDGLYVRGQDPRTRAILEGMVALCRALGVEAIAEMVECEAQATRLRALGVRFGQGFLFGRPEPVDRLESAPRA